MIRVGRRLGSVWLLAGESKLDHLHYSLKCNYDADTNCSGSNSFLGLLVSKTDARGIRTCAQYDTLNRITQKSYSDGTTPTAFFAYDGTGWWGVTQTNTIGRLMEQWTGTSCCATAGAGIFSYDAMGRVLLNEQYTPATGYRPVNYTYDLAGNATSITYPSGRIVNYSYDSASRPKTAADGSNGITYATDFQSVPTGCLTGAVCYTPQGSFYALSIGQTSTFSGLNLTHSYNSRLQPNEFKASSTGGNAIDITYGFVDPVTTHNAGHVYSIANNLDATRSQTFTYDQLNRIKSALTTSTYASTETIGQMLPIRGSPCTSCASATASSCRMAPAAPCAFAVIAWRRSRAKHSDYNFPRRSCPLDFTLRRGADPSLRSVSGRANL